LTELDRTALRQLVEEFDGGPIGLQPFATSLGMSEADLKTTVEPHLVRAGLMVHDPKGRAATAATWVVIKGSVPVLVNGWR
jgi:holliday junction DNA helicase RuvB